MCVCVCVGDAGNNKRSVSEKDCSYDVMASLQGTPKSPVECTFVINSKITDDAETHHLDT